MFIQLVKNMDFIVKKSTVFIAIFLSCFSHHEQVDMSATLFLTVENNSNKKITIKYIKPKEFAFGDSIYLSGNDKINLKHDTLILDSLEKTYDTICYELTRADYCYIEKYTAKSLRLRVDFFKSDTLYYQTFIFPWDTAAPGEEVENCHKEYWDTLKIE